MFIEALIIALVIGYVRGGRISNIGNMNIRAWFLVVIAFIIQMLPIFFSSIPIVREYGYYISFAAMFLMLLLVFINIEKKGFWLIAIGAIMNIVAMWFNDLLMPISFQGLTYIGFPDVVEAVKQGDIINYISIENISHWSVNLGKAIILPRWYPFTKLLSLGDILMSLGLFWFAQSEMLQQHHFKGKSKMIHYSVNSKW